jgi:hypothetical protein
VQGLQQRAPRGGPIDPSELRTRFRDPHPQHRQKHRAATSNSMIKMNTQAGTNDRTKMV